MKILRAAVRMVMFVIATLGLYSFWFVCSFFIPNKIYWRQITLKSWAKSFMKIARMRIEIIGKPPIAPFFLVSNHLSYIDIGVFRAAVETVFVAKKEVRSWFLAGRICDDMGTIFIDRQNRRDIPRAGQEILDALERREGVTVFPEGTSTKGEEILKFNSSFLEFAAKSDLPVHYAALMYQTPAGELPASQTITWWDDKSFMEHLWNFFKLKNSTAIISFGEKPITNPNRKELAQQLWQGVNENFTPVL